MPKPQPQRILVIKLSALGDIVVSLGALQAIRAHHRDARITLLTTRPYVWLAEASGLFDEIWTDERPAWWRIGHWRAFQRRLRAAGFARVYDLQRSERTGWYFRLLGRDKLDWVGIVPGCSHRYTDPPGPLHITERHARMLALAGIAEVPPPDLSFLTADVARFGIEAPYALLVPGSSAHMRLKRWPAARYGELARDLAARGLAPVLICGPDERAAAREIAAACPEVHDIETNLRDAAALARGATLAVGNDTGPMHLIAAAGCPSLVLFPGGIDPVKTAPRGKRVITLQEDSLADLPLARVLAALEELEAGD